MISKKSIVFFVIAIVLMILIVLYYYWPTKEETFNQSLQPVNVKTAEAKIVSKPDIINLIGILKAKNIVTITSKISGTVAERLFKNGQSVHKGQLLLKLENQTYQLQLEAAKVQLKQYEDIYKKSELLFKRRAISEYTYNTAIANYQMQKIQVATLEKTIHQTIVKAPFTGMLGSSFLTVGSYLSTGKSIVKLVNTDNLLAVYNIPGELYPKLKLGQETTISSDAYPDKLFKGKVTFVSPIIDENTNTITVQALIPNLDHILTAGMYVTVWQNLGDKKSMVEVPNIALVSDISGNQVYIVKNKKAKLVDVKVNAIINNTAYITSGLKNGDQIIVEGQEKLKDGDLVNIINPKLNIGRI
ncbi:MAG: efflux RND transporter periplasmic adaptor subunit [Gammaproteobacteria bacterium]|nr:MAG: efflux RND transporter periplasmic adaptor subunit [Gammaproteobacteria bacterium]UTW43695.1 efflux RND transporter periplasmic adaptor subunit [bacterium SCSIO 12844]